MPDRRLKIGLVINPVAGLGGPTGLKGTDGMVAEALRRGGVSRVADRVQRSIGTLPHHQIDWYSAAGRMGGDLLRQLNVPFRVVSSAKEPTSAVQTRQAVAALQECHIDLLLFAGGDGTARDVVDSYRDCPAVLGIPCGVKMHSGVFATSPGAALELLNKLVTGEMLTVGQAEVRDIDEASFREGIVRTEFYGELPVPEDLRYVQQTKIGGREVDELVIQDIAADFLERMDNSTLYVMSSGSTIAGMLSEMGLDSTLLGVDLLQAGTLVDKDVTEAELVKYLSGGQLARIVVTAIGGQGHILGRGNQQISPAVLRLAGIDNLEIVASKSKLAALERRPLLVDTGDPELDAALSGLRPVITGYEDHVLYRVA